MKALITQKSANNAKAKAKPYEIRDTKLSGFIVRVQPTGRKAYYCEYSRGKRFRIGAVEAWDAKEARDRARQVIVEFEKEGTVDALKRKLEADTRPLTSLAFLEAHYLPWVDANHKSALETRRKLLRDCKAFHHLALAEITPQRVEKWRTERVSRGCSPHTANRGVAYLRASLSKSVEWGHLEDHPLRRMKLIRAEDNAKVRFLSDNEETRLRRALSQRDRETNAKTGSNYAFCDHLSPMVRLSLNTGLRRGELFDLTWESIDFQAKRLTVDAKKSKSKKARSIPLNTEAVDVLTTWRDQSYQRVDHVIPRKGGERFNTVRKGWMKLLECAQIENFRWHDLRHHFASKLAMAGVDLNTIRELLGHSSYAVTLRYAHLSEGHKADAVALL